ncbi:retrovirus-related pol polyprotein from transposon TNT 1-94, partial [Tanacetum coccineum]
TPLLPFRCIPEFGGVTAGVWPKLETLYMTKSLANKLYLKKKLYTLCMPTGRKIFEHIDEFNKIVLDLANIEVNFEDKGLALLLLTSLPASYVHFVDTLLYGREALTLEDAMATLNSKEIKERSKAKGDDGEGLYVRGGTDRRDSRQSRGNSRSKSRGERLKCYIFQSEDHLKRNCLKNNRKKSSGYVKKDEQPSSSGSTYDDFEVMMMMSTQAQALLDWIMDSGCLYHMTPMLDILFDFLECDGDNVQLGDNRECKIKGIGKVRVQLKDGSSFVLHNVSLVQVWHKRLGHISEAGLKVLEKQGLFGKKSLGGYVFISSGSNTKHLESSNSGSRCEGYRLYRIDDESPKILTSRNVVFNESVMYKDTLKDSGAGDKSVEELQVEVELQRLNNHTPEEDQIDQEDGDDEDVRDQATDQPTDLTNYQLVQDREPRTRTKPLRFRDESNMAAYSFVAVEEEDTHEPLTYLKTVACEDSSK